MSQLVQKSSALTRAVLIFLITAIRPILGKSYTCPLQPGCTQLALHLLQSQPLYRSIPTIVKRLLVCNPVGFLLMRFSKTMRTSLQKK